MDYLKKISNEIGKYTKLADKNFFDGGWMWYIAGGAIIIFIYLVFFVGQ